MAWYLSSEIVLTALEREVFKISEVKCMQAGEARAESV